MIRVCTVCHSFNNILDTSIHNKMDSFKLKTGVLSKLFVCVEGLWPSQPGKVMSSMVTLSNHTFTGQA